MQAQTSTDTIALTVDASKPGAKIDRNIFGQFAEHLGTGIYEGVWVGPDSPIPNTRGIRNDVVAALKALKVPNVRWPGGCFADEYHWRKGIGPAARRRPSTPTGAASSSRTRFGTHEFMDFIDQIGSEAYLSVNVGSGTPQEAAEWLEYLTTDQPTALAKERAANGHPAPYKIPYLGHRQRELGLRRQHDAGVLPAADDDLQPLRPQLQSRRSAKATADAEDRRRPRRRRAAVDGVDRRRHEGLAGPPVELGHGRPVPAQLHGDEVAAGVRVRRVRREGVRARSSRRRWRWTGSSRRTRPSWTSTTREKKIALVVDEWGAWYAKLPGSTPGFLVQQNSLRDAVLAALNLNIFARHADRVRMANIAQMVNVLQAMILTDKEKMVLTPTYHVFKMYVPFQDATFVPVTFDAGTYTHGDITLPRVDAIAAKDAAGKLWLAVTNVDPDRPAKIAATCRGLTPRSAAGETLTGPGVDSVNTFEAPTTVAPKPIAAKVQGDRSP